MVGYMSCGLYALALRSAEHAPGMCCTALRALLPQLLPLVVNQAIMSHSGPMDFAAPLYRRFDLVLNIQNDSSVCLEKHQTCFTIFSLTSRSIAPLQSFHRELASRGLLIGHEQSIVDAHVCRSQLRQQRV